MIDFIIGILFFLSLFILFSIFVGYLRKRHLKKIRKEIEKQNKLTKINAFFENIDFSFIIYIYKNEEKIVFIKINNKIHEEIIIDFKDIVDINLIKREEVFVFENRIKYYICFKLNNTLKDYKIDLMQEFKNNTFSNKAIAFFDYFKESFLLKEKNLLNQILKD